MNEEQIKQRVEDALSEKVESILDISKGLDQIVKIIKTEKNKYIYKAPRNREETILIFREVFACEKMKGLVPVPKIIYKGDDFIIQEYIDGKNLDTVDLYGEQEKKIYCDLGKYLQKIHTVGTEGYGFIDIHGRGKLRTLREMALGDIEKQFLVLQEEKIISPSEIETLKKYIEQNKNYLDSDEKVFLHFDYEDDNVLIKGEKIMGIIDFGDISSGPRAFDLVRPYIRYYKTKNWDYFLEGYGEVDIEEVKYFTTLSLLWMIPFHHKIADRDGMEKRLKILRDIVK
ncbi:MAG: aminoglycoside phosphotransferase family protein [Candidatus Magasanikbacteria bacterium]